MANFNRKFDLDKIFRFLGTQFEKELHKTMTNLNFVYLGL
jgi:hypothetical protein